ncbi:MAG: nucleotidyltransferase family protein [Planctomycetota bacterium]|jgi:predicted nucleotidyltransferase
MQIHVDPPRLRTFCTHWQIQELAVFGSALRDDFGPDSDLDILVTFADTADWGLLDLVRMEREFAELTGRKVYLVDRRSIARSSNWLRREEILSSAVSMYAA